VPVVGRGRVENKMFLAARFRANVLTACDERVLEADISVCTFVFDMFSIICFVARISRKDPLQTTHPAHSDSW
jgi:hypothetical protein